MEKEFIGKQYWCFFSAGRESAVEGGKYRDRFLEISMMLNDCPFLRVSMGLTD